MKEIKVSHLKAIIDDEDFDLVSRHNWWLTGSGYAYTQTCVKGKRTTILMHRLVIGVAQGKEVDHKNLQKLDNRKSNLRVATRSQNNANRRPTVGIKGVRWSKNAWQAEIKKDRKYIYIGRYKTMEDAAAAYNREALRLFGEFAWLNPVGSSDVGN